MNNILQLLFFTCLFSHFHPSFGQNTTCATAQLIEPGTFTIDSISGNGAIFEGATGAAWYRYEPTQDGVFTVSSCDGKADTRLVILLLDNCAQTTDLQIVNSVEDNCSDGLGGNSASTIEVVALAGFSYVIYWDNGQSSKGFTWTLALESEENNQAGATCETADSISIGSHQIDSLTGNGTAFLDAVSAKWYVFRPDKDGILAISSCESAIDTRLFVWEGICANKTLIAQDDNGCANNGAADLNDVSVVANQAYLIYWDDHWTKEGFTFTLNVEDPMVATKEPIWAENLQIFPNPAQEVVFINYDFGKNLDLQFSIINNLGKVVQYQEWSNFRKGQIEVALNSLPSGIYYLVLQTEVEGISRKLIVKN